MRTTLLLLFIALGCALGLPFTQAWAFTTDSQENICATPAVVFCDNFENRALGNGDFNRAIYKNLGWVLSCCGNTTVSIVNTQARDGSHAVQFTYPINNGAGGIVNDNGIGGALPDAYIRWYTKWGNPTFQFSGIATKHMIPLDQTFSQPNEFGYLFGEASGINMGLQYSNSNPDQAGVLRPNISSYTEQTNVWVCYEIHIKGNRSQFSTDGVFEGWINGTRLWNYENLNLSAKSSSGYVTNGLNASGYWNCTNGDIVTHPCTSGTPQDTHPVQYRYLDNVVISTQRIGCLGTPITQDIIPPSAPRGLIFR